MHGLSRPSEEGAGWLWCGNSSAALVTASVLKGLALISGDVKPEPFTSNQMNAAEPLRIGVGFPDVLSVLQKSSFSAPSNPMLRTQLCSGTRHRGLVGGSERLDCLQVLVIPVLMHSLLILQLRYSVVALPACWDLHKESGGTLGFSCFF